MKLRTPRRDEPEINLISMVDVVLILLIFFMLTTTFARQSQLTVHLPEASARSKEGKVSPSLEVGVTERGLYLVNGRVLVDARAETLAEAIRRLSIDRTQNDVTISADANASHQSVVTAMDVLGRLGYTDVHIATVRSTRSPTPEISK